MTLLAGAASFFVGNAYSSQMPGFANDLGHGDPGVSYSMLLAADAAGGLLAGIVLEGGGLLPPRPRTAIVLAMLWCAALAIFSLSKSYPLALVLPVCRRISWNCPSTPWRRAWSSSMLRPTSADASSACSTWRASACAPSAAFPSACVGSLIGVHWSLALSALATMIVAGGLLAIR